MFEKIKNSNFDYDYEVIDDHYSTSNTEELIKNFGLSYRQKRVKEFLIYYCSLGDIKNFDDEIVNECIVHIHFNDDYCKFYKQLLDFIFPKYSYEVIDLGCNVYPVYVFFKFDKKEKK